MNQAYLLRREGRDYSAPDLDTLRRWAQEGRVLPADMVWSPVYQSWYRASDLRGLRDVLPQPPEVAAPPVAVQAAAQCFWLRKGDQNFAADSLEVVLQWASDGNIEPDDFIFHPGYNKWFRAGDSPQLATRFPPHIKHTPPFLPTSQDPMASSEVQRNPEPVARSVLASTPEHRALSSESADSTAKTVMDMQAIRVDMLRPSPAAQPAAPAPAPSPAPTAQREQRPAEASPAAKVIRKSGAHSIVDAAALREAEARAGEGGSPRRATEELPSLRPGDLRASALAGEMPSIRPSGPLGRAPQGADVRPTPVGGLGSVRPAGPVSAGAAVSSDPVVSASADVQRSPADPAPVTPARPGPDGAASPVSRAPLAGALGSGSTPVASRPTPEGAAAESAENAGRRAAEGSPVGAAAPATPRPMGLPGSAVAGSTPAAAPRPLPAQRPVAGITASAADASTGNERKPTSPAAGSLSASSLAQGAAAARSPLLGGPAPSARPTPLQSSAGVGAASTTAAGTGAAASSASGLAGSSAGRPSPGVAQTQPATPPGPASSPASKPTPPTPGAQSVSAQAATPRAQPAAAPASPVLAQAATPLAARPTRPPPIPPEPSGASAAVESTTARKPAPPPIPGTAPAAAPAPAPAPEPAVPPVDEDARFSDRLGVMKPFYDIAKVFVYTRDLRPGELLESSCTLGANGEDFLGQAKVAIYSRLSKAVRAHVEGPVEAARAQVTADEMPGYRLMRVRADALIEAMRAAEAFIGKKPPERVVVGNQGRPKMSAEEEAAMIEIDSALKRLISVRARPATGQAA
jgi:hypothetical protein